MNTRNGLDAEQHAASRGVVDAIRWAESIRVMIEDGHFPSRRLGVHRVLLPDAALSPASIVPIEQRLPTRPPAQPTPNPPHRSGTVADIRRLRDERFATYSQRMAKRTDWRNIRSREESDATTAQATHLRRRFQ